MNVADSKSNLIIHHERPDLSDILIVLPERHIEGIEILTDGSS
ncbi:MAG: hypothetical protein ABGZ53_29750 [Fuerstiella sp.]